MSALVEEKIVSESKTNQPSIYIFTQPLTSLSSGIPKEEIYNVFNYKKNSPL